MYEIILLFVERNNSPVHGREISRLLKQNQKTVQNYLEMLEAEAVLRKQVAGRNYNYCLDIGSGLCIYYLVMAENYRLLKLLKKEFEVLEIVNEIRLMAEEPVLIYGSYAKGYQRKSSDLDILLVSGRKHDIAKIQVKYAKRIHLMQLDRVSFEKGLSNKEAFPMEILQNHIICQGFEYFARLWAETNG